MHELKDDCRLLKRQHIFAFVLAGVLAIGFLTQGCMGRSPFLSGAQDWLNHNTTRLLEAGVLDVAKLPLSQFKGVSKGNGSFQAYCGALEQPPCDAAEVVLGALVKDGDLKQGKAAAGVVGAGGLFMAAQRVTREYVPVMGRRDIVRVSQNPLLGGVSIVARPVRVLAERIVSKGDIVSNTNGVERRSVNIKCRLEPAGWVKQLASEFKKLDGGKDKKDGRDILKECSGKVVLTFTFVKTSDGWKVSVVPVVGS